MSPSKPAREFALELVAKRALSKRELESKLIRKGYANTDVADALAIVQEYGYVDEKELAAAVVREAVRMGRGIRWIEHTLRRRGIDESATPTEEQHREAKDQAHQLLLRTYGEPASLSPKERGKAYAFLARRGFTPDDIRLLVGVDDQLD